MGFKTIRRLRFLDNDGDVLLTINDSDYDKDLPLTETKQHLIKEGLRWIQQQPDPKSLVDLIVSIEITEERDLL